MVGNSELSTQGNAMFPHLQLGRFGSLYNRYNREARPQVNGNTFLILKLLPIEFLLKNEIKKVHC